MVLHGEYTRKLFLPGVHKTGSHQIGMAGLNDMASGRTDRREHRGIQGGVATRHTVNPALGRVTI